MYFFFYKKEKNDNLIYIFIQTAYKQGLCTQKKYKNNGISTDFLGMQCNSSSAYTNSQFFSSFTMNYFYFCNR